MPNKLSNQEFEFFNSLINSLSFEKEEELKTLLMLACF